MLARLVCFAALAVLLAVEHEAFEYVEAFYKRRRHEPLRGWLSAADCGFQATMALRAERSPQHHDQPNAINAALATEAGKAIAARRSQPRTPERPTLQDSPTASLGRRHHGT